MIFKTPIVFLIFTLVSLDILAQLEYKEIKLSELGIKDLELRSLSFVDINQDGILDIWTGSSFLTGNIECNYDKEKNFNFKTGITSFIDYDGDGDKDIISLRPSSIQLYVNESKRKLKFRSKNISVWKSKNFQNEQLKDLATLDVNNDGCPDLYVSSYEFPFNSAIGQADHLYLNDCEGKFEDISINSGISSSLHCSRGISIADINQDGFQDIYVSNYRLHPNDLWINQKNNKFKNNADSLGVTGKIRFYQYGHSIGSAIGDIDGNGCVDIFTPITHHVGNAGDDNNHLWLNTCEPDFSFFDHQIDDIKNAEIGASPQVIDLDNDGDLDISFVNLYGRPQSRIYFYENIGGNFTDISSNLNIDYLSKTDHLHFVDLNHDGFLDILFPILSKSNYVYKIYLAQKIRDHHSITLLISDSHNGSNAIGAEVSIWACGEKQQRWLNHSNGNSYGSMFNPQIHFGLGNCNNIDSMKIQYLSGEKLSFYDLDADHAYHINANSRLEITKGF